MEILARQPACRTQVQPSDIRRSLQGKDRRGCDPDRAHACGHAHPSIPSPLGRGSLVTLSPQFLDELRARTLLSGLIGKSVKLQRAGREWKACCPFHQEKTPSFTINDDKGFYHCFGCGAHGDAIRYLTEAQGLPFMDAVKELAQAAGMTVPAPDPRAADRAERASGLHDVMAAASRWFEEQLDGIAGAEARAYL